MNAADRIAAAPISRRRLRGTRLGSSPEPQQVLAEIRAAGARRHRDRPLTGSFRPSRRGMTRLIHELPSRGAAIADGRPSGPSAWDGYAAHLIVGGLRR